MDIGWSYLVLSPVEEAITTLEQSWASLVPQPWTPLLLSILGDVLFERQPDGVFRLNTGTGEVAWIADNSEQFRAAHAIDSVKTWLFLSWLPHSTRREKYRYPGNVIRTPNSLYSLRRNTRSGTLALSLRNRISACQERFTPKSPCCPTDIGCRSKSSPNPSYPIEIERSGISRLSERARSINDPISLAQARRCR
jgi:hypothetical protein